MITTRSRVHRPPSHPWRRLHPPLSLATFITIAGLALLVAPRAVAHDEVVSATPESGSTVGSAPADISRTFSGEILTDFSAVVIEVIDSDGQNIASAAPVIDGTDVTRAVRPGQPGATDEATPGAVHGTPSGGGELLPVLATVTGALALGGILAALVAVVRARHRSDRDAARITDTDTDTDERDAG